MCDHCLARLSDEGLVAAFRAGDDRAFAELHRRHRARLERAARRLVADRTPGPEDVVQEVFLRAHAALRADERPVAVLPWLLRMVRNRSIDELRRAHAVAVPDAGVTAPADPAGDPLTALLAGQELRAVVRDVRALPDRQRDAFVGHALDGRPHQAVATRLGITPKASKALVHRARQALTEQAALRAAA